MEDFDARCVGLVHSLSGKIPEVHLQKRNLLGVDVLQDLLERERQHNGHAKWLARQLPRARHHRAQRLWLC